MAGIRMRPASRVIGAIFREGSATGMTDEQLLERFVSQCGAAAEHAFECLSRGMGRWFWAFAGIHSAICTTPRAAFQAIEGLTHEEAARQLGWPMGTLGVRLMRARERLRARLTRRGLAPNGLAALQLAPRAEPLATPLLARTARAAVSSASRTAPNSGAISSQVTAIAVGVLRTMSIQRITTKIAAILACGLVAAGAAAVGLQAPPKRPSTGTSGPSSQKGSPAKGVTKSILANGGFERGDARGPSPDSWKTGAALPGVRYHWDRTVAHRGRASLHLRKTAPRYFPIAQSFQEVKRTAKRRASRSARSSRPKR